MDSELPALLHEKQHITVGFSALSQASTHHSCLQLKLVTNQYYAPGDSFCCCSYWCPNKVLLRKLH